MKKLLLLLALPLVGMGSMQTPTYDLGQEIATELHELEMNENMSDRMRAVIAQKKINTISKKHAKKNFDGYVQIINEMLEERAPSDTIYDILVRVFGKEIADVIIKVSGLPSIEKRLGGLLVDWKLLLNAQDCPKGVKLVAGHLAFIGTVAAIAVFAPPAFVVFAVPAGVLAGEVVEMSVSISGINVKLCDIIWKKYGRFSFAY